MLEAAEDELWLLVALFVAEELEVLFVVGADFLVASHLPLEFTWYLPIQVLVAITPSDPT